MNKEELEELAKDILKYEKHEIIMKIKNWLDNIIENGNKDVNDNRESILKHYKDEYLKLLIIEYLKGLHVEVSVFKTERIIISYNCAVDYVLSKIKEEGIPQFAVAQNVEEPRQPSIYFEDDYEM